MIKALFTAATGMSAQQTMVDTTSNNLANVNTTGFKRMSPQFQDLIYVTERTPGSIAQQGLPLPTGLQLGSGVAVSGTEKIFTPGTLNNTTNPYDVAIDGDGFFQVTMPSGLTEYTRAGNFSLNNNGNLVTSDGFLINPQIAIPQAATSVSIGTDGTVSVMTPGATAPTQVGQLTLVRFQNPAGLNNEGRNLYSATQSSGQAVQTQPGQQGAGLIRQGYLEGSNVDVVAEMVNLIVAQRLRVQYQSHHHRRPDAVFHHQPHPVGSMRRVFRPNLIAAVLLLANIAGRADGPAAAEPIVLVLRAEATVSASQVTIGDVATLQGGDAQERERIAKLDLTELPLSSQPIFVSQHQLGFRLQIAGIEDCAFRLEGPRFARVSRPAGDALENKIAALARQTLEQKLPGRVEDVAIQLVQPVRLPPLSADGEDIHLEAELRSSVVVPCRVLVEVGIYIRGARRMGLPVYLDVKKLQSVPVAVRRLEAGDTFGPDNIRVERVPVENSQRVVVESAGLMGRALDGPSRPAGSSSRRTWRRTRSPPWSSIRTIWCS